MLMYTNYVTRPTYQIAKQGIRRGYLYYQEQETCYRKNQTQEIQLEASQASCLRRDKEITKSSLRRVFCCSMFPIAVVAQLVEHSIGNGEVTGSIPVNGSIFLHSIPVMVGGR